jgi:hypothetical protein
MNCSICNLDKKHYDFVLPPGEYDISQICRKCYHIKQGIDDKDYETFIIIYSECHNLIDVTTELIEKVEEDIENNNLEQFNSNITPEQYLDSLYHFMEMYRGMIRGVERKMKHIELWTKLINN